jgi:hypothetical protein
MQGSASAGRVAGWVIALAAAGCGGSAKRAATPAPAAPAGSLEEQARGIAVTVAKIRGLAPKQPIEIRSLDDDAFTQAFEARLKRVEPESPQPLVGQAARARADLFLGFYDEGLHVVFVRQRLPKWASERTNPRALLAHEIEHALQDQYFGLGKLTSIKEPDQRLAYLALIEGDAELVGIAFEATERKRSWRRAIVRDTASDALATDTMIRIGGFSPDLLKSSPATREMTTFPYVSGRAFVGALFRAGGFELVNKAFSRPPDATEQVLHPEKYVEGERPVPVRDPVLPPGYEVRQSLTFGELLTRSVLQRTYPVDQARLLASGWGGDRVTLIRTPAGGEGVLWVSAWDNPESAARFEEAVRNSGENPRTGVAELVVRDGTRVALVAGVPRPLQPAMAKDLLALPQGAPARQPPVGQVRIPDAPTPLENRPELRGVVRGGVYQSAALSVRAEVPAGFAFATDKPSLQLLVVRREPTLATGAFAFSSDALDAHGEESIHKAAVEGFVGRMAGSPRPRLVSSNALHTPLGKGSDRTWAVEKSGMFFRTVLVAACDGLGAFLFTLVWVDDEGRRMLDRWMGGFAEQGPRPSPLCKELAKDAEESP